MDKRGLKFRRVDIISLNFFDWEGKIVYRGGAERYIYDLAKLLKRYGCKVRIVQCSSVPFERRYKGVEVVGTGFGNRDELRENSRNFANFCSEADIIVASPIELACEINNLCVLGINHGISFDGCQNVYASGVCNNYDEYVRALRNVRKCVCVDTNFINWTRTVDYESSLKECYIPNYFNEKMVMKMPKLSKRKRGSVRIIYPRRICEERGYDLAVKAFEQLMPKYQDILFVDFVGQISEPGAREVIEELMDKYPKNVTLREYDMEEMGRAYRGADISLIPTKNSEGTSLSCIESMAFGIAVIATDVGGLPNLIIDGYNGLLIAPTVDELTMAIERMILNKKARKDMARKGRIMARQAFTQKKWESKWLEVFNDLEEN